MRASQIIAAVSKVSFNHGLWLVARVNKKGHLFGILFHLSKCSLNSCCPKENYAFSCCSAFFGGITQRSFTTSPARISPATDGTNAILPGIARRSVHLCFAPGGQIQFFRQLMLMSSCCSTEALWNKPPLISSLRASLTRGA